MARKLVLGDRAMTGAERSKRWWENVKKDPERHGRIKARKNKWEVNRKETDYTISPELMERQKRKADEILRKVGLK